MHNGHFDGGDREATIDRRILCAPWEEPSPSEFGSESRGTYGPQSSQSQNVGHPKESPQKKHLEY